VTRKGSIELLAPAGGPEAFNAALAGGADAIYCGLGNSFNARRSAHNFDDESFAAACRRAHLAGARVYVTENVVIATHEMPEALELVRRAWVLGADAFIIQDWGLLSEVRRSWPQIECHVSTQANVHDARGVAWCRDLGVERVTLSRELSLPEIRRISEEGVELECFGHGALCICYSGVCMMSSLAGGRSANRGLCAQPCRLPYDLVDEKGNVIEGTEQARALCPKDYCVVDDLAEMRDAGVGSIKVEGRMKAPDYVLSVISSYRQALDALESGKPLSKEEDAAMRRRLRRAFNRDFTHAYLMGRSGSEMMSYERSNNRGELVGEVLSSRRLEDEVVRRGGSDGGRERMRRLTRAEVTIRLDKPVGEGDLLELRPLEDPSQFLTVHAVSDAVAGDTMVCRASRPVPARSTVRVIRSQAAMEEASRAAGMEVPRKRAVKVRIVSKLGKPFSVTLSCADGSATATAEGFVVEKARTRAVSEKDLVEHVGRMGQTPFVPVSFDVDLDEGCGMGFSAVHGVRAKACDALEQEILDPYAARLQGLSVTPSLAGIASRLSDVRAAAGIREPSAWTRPEPEACALVSSVDAARAALEAGATRVYATPDALSDGVWPEGVIPWLDEVCRELDHDRLDPWVSEGAPVGVGNVSELALAAQRGAAAEIRPCIPVHNESCIVALESAGAKGFWLSPELTLEEVCSLAKASSVPVGLVVSGRARAMTTEHCVLQVAGQCINDCAHCKLRQRRLSLRDVDGNLLPVRTDIHGRSRIWAAHPLDATPQAAELVSAGVTRLMADATLLSPEECAFAVARVRRALEAAREGRRPAARVQGATSGHLFSGIG
jgi:putative protease